MNGLGKEIARLLTFCNLKSLPVNFLGVERQQAVNPKLPQILKIQALPTISHLYSAP